jgi:hypothetical protein
LGSNLFRVEYHSVIGQISESGSNSPKMHVYLQKVQNMALTPSFFRWRGVDSHPVYPDGVALIHTHKHKRKISEHKREISNKEYINRTNISFSLQFDNDIYMTF